MRVTRVTRVTRLTWETRLTRMTRGPGWPGWLGWPRWPGRPGRCGWQGQPGQCGWPGRPGWPGGVFSIILGMLESLGFLKYSTLLVFQLFSWRLSLCHSLCNLCLCISVPFSFLNSYHHKLSENVWVWGYGATRSEIWSDVTMAGQTNNQPTNKER